MQRRPPVAEEYEYFDRGNETFYARNRTFIWLGSAGGAFSIYYLLHLEEVPMTKRRRFIDISPDEEVGISRSAYASVMQQYQHLIVSPYHPTAQFVRKVAERIIRVSNMPNMQWEVHLIDSPERNAFVLPTGKVFVFTGLLPVVQNEDGLAAVIGHEVAHVLARHSAEKMSWAKVAVLGQVLVSFLFDASWIFNRLFLELGIMMPFSRKCEVEADLIGLNLMAEACYDPREAAGVWVRMKQADRGASNMEYLSTHPSHESRIKKIQEWLPEAMKIRENSDCAAVRHHLAVAVAKFPTDKLVFRAI
ncbi:hypothetical protein HK101_007193 [Irineochytrium annulatum]|nr:hypothetical protein HK101_007193 [Irineochytrium annulatum]